MQSYLQARRIGLAVQAQIERDQEKAQRITLQHSNNNNNARTTPATATDTEKIEGPANAAGREDKNTNSSSSSSSSSSASDDASSSSSSSHNGDEDNDDPTGAAAERVPTTATMRTQYTSRAALGHSLTGVAARDRRTHEGGRGTKVFVVGWEEKHAEEEDEGGDPLCPRNWSTARKVGCTLQISLIAACVGTASGIDATVLPQAARALGVSEVAESLDTGMYLIGMGIGSLVAGPFSETFGRNYVYMASMVIYMLWIMACGLAPNFAAQVVFRFLAGCAASTPLVCSGGSISDLYDGLAKTWGFPIYAISAFGGPMLGAVMGAYIGPSPLVSWRWTEWVVLILSGLVTVTLFLCMPETYAPLLLRWKAAHLRRITGDDRFRAEHEIVEATLLSRLRVSMTRPFVMLREPIIIAMTVYLSVVYIVLFTFLVSFPYVFQYTYDISQGLSNVVFAAMFVGTEATYLLVPVVYRMTANQIRLAEARGEGRGRFNPEIRLMYAMLGSAVAIPVSLFWLGWTDFASVSIWSPICAVALFGYGVMGIFLCAYMYIIDAYEMYSASALTFVAVVRYVAAGGMTVVGIPWYESMGTHYTLTILACISCLLAPIPYALYRWGYIIRKRSKYAVSKEI
ncbi:major facilitator superfamily transporter [Xylariaceae sp. FL0804]|nr:major facilitator superfamily transporter [Xylariaceae sp. FL0804]